MTKEKVDFSQFAWMNRPEQVETTADTLEFVTSPETDFWQRTDYGFRRNTGHAFLTRLWDDFSFSAQTEFFYEAPFDQSGLFLYLDENNWAKVSLEFGDESESESSMLGSVVTQNGYSDWASSPVNADALVSRMFYRISRRGQDFRFDCSFDGDTYQQMRVFHMFSDLSLAKIGVYACSPGDASFRVRFTEITAQPSLWID